MATLKSNDFNKNASNGIYAGQNRHDIFGLKIKDKKQFIIGSTKSGQKVTGISYDKKTGELTYKERATSTVVKLIKNTRIFKDADFGGGSGSGGGADDTKYTESMQCYYCSYSINIAKKKFASVTPTELAKGEPYVYATKSLKECLTQGPPDWVETDVYIKTANKFHEKYGQKFRGKVYFHRGSTFMDNVYAAKTKTHKLDKETGSPQAPGSFSHDKWNPGDIWATSFTSTLKPLAQYTSSWGELNDMVLTLSGASIPETKLIGISLKKIGASMPNAKLQEFGKTPSKGNYTFQSYQYGKTGDFFGSQDIYLSTSEGEVQFRTFGGDTSWQGEIKGGSAAGGKIGGGNVNFYCHLSFDQGIYGKFDNEKTLIANLKLKKEIDIINHLYAYYKKYNKGSKPSKPLLSIDEFTLKYKVKQSLNWNWTVSKVICMNFLDTIMSGTMKERNEFVTKMYKYAQSDTEQSSYFIKLY